MYAYAREIMQMKRALRSCVRVYICKYMYVFRICQTFFWNLKRSVENFVACLRLGRSLILSCICRRRRRRLFLPLRPSFPRPLVPLLSISFNSVKRDSFLLWSAVLRTLVCWWIAWRPWSLLRRCHAYASDASLPGSCTVPFLFARSHAQSVSLAPSYVRGQDQPYTLLRQRPTSLPVVFTAPSPRLPPLLFISLLFPLPSPSLPFYPAAKAASLLVPDAVPYTLLSTCMHLRPWKVNFIIRKKGNWHSKFCVIAILLSLFRI